MTPLLRVEGLVKTYGGGVQALRGVDLELAEGEIVGLVGESGCGKSTLGRCILRLEEPTAGRVLFGGVEITNMSQRRLRPLRRRLQMIFQDPYQSLDPRMTVLGIVGEALKIHGLVRGKQQLEERVVALLEQVGLDASALSRYPHEFSGGQRQRIGIARVLADQPQLVVADEPVSALDVSVQAQIINLLSDLRRQHGLGYLLISHDLRVVGHLCQRVVVMYLGRLVEEGAVGVVAGPGACHPYTRALVAATPVLLASRPPALVLGGEVPSPVEPPTGCAFHPRCPVYADRGNQRCVDEQPDLRTVDAGHRVACHEARHVALDSELAKR